MHILKLLSIMSLIVLAISCRKSEIDNDTEIQSSIDHIFSEFICLDAWNMVDEEAKLDAGLRGSRSCAMVTSNTGVTPMELTLDFGSGCTDNGHRRSGMIQAFFTGQYTDSLTVVTINFVNYMVDSNMVTGSITVTNRGNLGSGYDVYTVAANTVRIDYPNPYQSLWTTWTSDYDIEWIGGFSTVSDPTDDVFAISGSTDGRGQKGNTFSSSITTNLSYENNCDFVKAGVVKLTPANLRTRTIDYGSGCDANASVTIENDSYDISY